MLQVLQTRPGMLSCLPSANHALQKGKEREMMKKQSQEAQLKQRQMAHKVVFF